MRLGMMATRNVGPKALSINMEIRDEFSACLLDDIGEMLVGYERYVLSLMPGDHYFDDPFLDMVRTQGNPYWENPLPSDVDPCSFTLRTPSQQRSTRSEDASRKRGPMMQNRLCADPAH